MGYQNPVPYIDMTKHEEEKWPEKWLRVCLQELSASPSGLQDYDRQIGLLLISTPLAPDYSLPTVPVII